MNVRLDSAFAQDLDEVLALLGEVNLPVEGVAEHFNRFWLTHDSGLRRAGALR